MSEHTRNPDTATFLHNIVQASAPEWSNDPDRETAGSEDVHEYAGHQVWTQLLSPAVKQVDGLPGFDQVDIEDPMYGATETTLMLHPSWSGPAGPNAVILSATDGNMAIREFRHDPAPLTHQEAAERLGVPTESFQQAVDHLETPLRHSGITHQWITDSIRQNRRDRVHTQEAHHQGSTTEDPTVSEQNAAFQHQTRAANAAENQPVKASQVMLKNALNNVPKPEWWETATPAKVSQYYNLSHLPSDRMNSGLSAKLQKTLDTECYREYGYSALEYGFEEKSQRDIKVIIEAQEVAQQEETPSFSTSVPESHYYSPTISQDSYQAPDLD